MIRYILIIAILSFTTLVQASTSKEKYIQGFKACESKDYATSYDLLSSIYLSHLSDKKLNFYLGYSAFKIGYYEIALASFERVSMIDPSDIRNQLEMARTYFMLKMFENSERLFRSVLTNPKLPKNVRKTVERYIIKMTKSKPKSTIYLTINFNWVYDSNINYASSKETYFYAPGKVNLGTPKKISDYATEFSAGIGNIYTNGKYAIKTNIMTYRKEYDSEESYNVSYKSHALSFLYRNTRHSTELTLSYDILKLSLKEYLNTYSVGPKYEYLHTPTLKSIAYFKYQSKFFQQAAQKNLNANRYVLSYGLQKILSRRSLIQVNLIGAQEKDSADLKDKSKLPIYVRYSEGKLNMIYMNQFSSRYDMQFFAEAYKRKYEDKSVIFRNQVREDNSKSASITLNANLAFGIRANIKATYTQVDSNQEIFQYDKHTLAFGMNKLF
jgi:hypothetical protein